MTTTPAPTDHGNIDDLVETAMKFLRYGDGYDHRRNLAKDLVQLVPSLTRQLADAERERDAAREELAKTRAELDESRRKECSALCRDVEEDRDRLLYDLSEDFHASSRCGVEGPECPGCVLEKVRAELTKTRAELDEAKTLLHTIWYGTVNAHARELWLRLIRDANPAATAEPAANLPCHCPDGRRVRYCLVHGEKATAEPADEPKATCSCKWSPIRHRIWCDPCAAARDALVGDGTPPWRTTAEPAAS